MFKNRKYVTLDPKLPLGLVILKAHQTSDIVLKINLGSLQPANRYEISKRLLAHGIGTKLVSNWKQNMFYTKISKFYL